MPLLWPVLVCLALLHAAGCSGLAKLNTHNFEKKVKKSDPLFVMYVAPWCELCEKVKPMWKKLAKENSKYIFGTFDCSLRPHEEFCEKHNVYGFPSIAASYKTRSDVQYLDRWTYENIEEWVKSLFAPVSIELMASGTKTRGDLIFILFGAKDKDIKLWNRIMEKYRGKYGIYHTKDNSVDGFSTDKPSVLIYKKFFDTKQIDMTEGEIEKYIEEESKIMVYAIDEFNFSRVFHYDGSFVYTTFIDTSNEEEVNALVESFKKPAEVFKDYFKFSYMDIRENEEYWRPFGTEEELPFSVVIYPSQFLYFKKPVDQSLNDFVLDVLNRKAEALELKKGLKI